MSINRATISYNYASDTQQPAGIRVSSDRLLYRVGLIISDTLMLILAFALAYWARFIAGVTVSPEAFSPPGYYGRLAMTIVPAWIALFALYRLYDYRILLGGVGEYARVFNACTTGAMLVILATFVQPDLLISRTWLIGAWLFSMFLIGSARFVLRRIAYAMRRSGRYIVRTAVVGCNEEALALAQRLSSDGRSGVSVVGLIVGEPESDCTQSTGAARPADDGRIPVLGTLVELPAIVHQWGIQEVVVATSALSRSQLIDLYEQIAALSDVELCLSSGLYEVITTRVEVLNRGSVPLFQLSSLRLEPTKLALKRALDCGLILLAAPLLLPLFVAIALLIKKDSPGPVFYRRQVLGAGGKVFDAFKFRTMVVNGDEVLQRHPHLLAALRDQHKLKDDPRITRMGQWLRRFSLDEVPQLVNVLLGQMSLVGPRMISPQESSMYGQQRLNLLTVKPGLTGLWQVSGRSDLSYAERVDLDMYYISNYSIWLDLQILFVHTLPAVLKARGAY